MFPDQGRPMWMITLLRRGLILSAAVVPLFAECADAGLCRLSPPSIQADGSWTVGLTLGQAAGSSEENVIYRNVTASLGWRSSFGLRLGGDLPVIDLHGRAGSASGLGDAIIRAEQRLVQRTWGELAFQVGARLPTGDDNANPGLPQGYQTGLGPTDLLVGLGWSWSDWSAGLGYSQSGGANALIGTELQRGDDLALRAGWHPSLARMGGLDGLIAGTELIAIRRLEDSTLLGSGGRISAGDGGQTQVNLRLSAAWSINRKWTVETTAVIPLRERPVDVDGLTRRYAIEFGSRLAF